MVLSAPADPVATGDLLESYAGPIYAYIRRCGLERHAAADLTQEFIARVLLERGLIQRADPQRGRFRSFLKAALRNFLTDQHRSAAARPDGLPSRRIDAAALERMEPSPAHEPHDAFDHQWAATLLSRTLQRLEADCLEAGQEVHWRCFQRVVVEPALGQVTPPALSDMAAEVGSPGPVQVSAMIQTVRRKFHRMLRQVVEETVQTSEEADQELRELREFLGV